MIRNLLRSTARPLRSVLRMTRGLRPRLTLRWKLSLAIAAVCTLVAVSMALIVHGAVARQQLTEARRVQDERLQVALYAYLNGGGARFGSQLDPPDLPSPVATAVRTGQRVTYLDVHHGDPTLWAAAEVDGHVLAVYASYASQQSAITDLDQTLILVGVGTVLGTTLIGTALATGMSRRLRRASRVAVRIADGDLDARVGTAPRRAGADEVDDLARALDVMADSLQRRIEAERRFTADIAHELRTPVTGLVTASELLDGGRPSELVRDRAQALRALVEDLLEISRLDAHVEVPELGEYSVAELVRRTVAVLGTSSSSTVPGLAAGRAQVPVVVVEDAQVETDPRRFERILVNLIGNAFRHGRPPVVVEVVGGEVRVTDRGGGFPAELLAEGPMRFRTGAAERGRGVGLGLTIAFGQAAVVGARLRLTSREGGGAVAIIDMRERVVGRGHPRAPRTDPDLRVSPRP